VTVTSVCADSNNWVTCGMCERLLYDYIRQVNGVKLADIMFSLCVTVCVSVRTQSHWFEWAE